MNQKEKRGPGRPRKAAEPVVPTMDNRIPLDTGRLKTKIYNKDPAYYYELVLDKAENGHNINRYQMAGFTFVRDGEGVTVGDSRVFKTESFGSLITVSEPDGQYLFLMKQPIEFKKEDDAIRERKLKQTEQDLFTPSKREGQYGSVRSEWKQSKD